MLLSEFVTDDEQNAGIVHVANELERRLRTCDQVYCELCIQVLANNAKVDDKMCMSIGKCRPCLSTFQLCKMTDASMKFLINTGPCFKNRIYNIILNNILLEDIFPEFYEGHDEDHKHFLVKYIVDEYINIKCAFLAKQTTIATQKKYLRNRYRKLVHFHHQ